MARIISSVTHHSTPDAAADTESGVSNILGYLSENVRIEYELRSPGRLMLKVEPGSDWGRALAVGTRFSQNDVVKITYDDASETYWRVYSKRINHEGGSAHEVECWPYWTMLDRRTCRVSRTPATFVDLTLALTGLSVSEALTIILGSSYNAPPYFEVGSVASAFSSSVVAIESNANTHLDLLWRLCDDLAVDNGGEPAEFEAVWNSGTSKFTINILEQVGRASGESVPDPASRPIDSPTGGQSATAGNRLRLTEQTQAQDYFNRIIPIVQFEDVTYGIGRAEWDVDSAVHLAGTTTVTLDTGSNPLPPGVVFASGTRYFGNATDGFFEIEDIPTLNSIDLTGDASALSGDRCRFAQDSSGTELVFLETSEATGADDIHEAVVEFPDIIPFENFIASSGLSADMSTFGVGDIPAGWNLTGSPATSQVTDPLYVRHGTKSVKIEANKLEGLQGVVTLDITSREPYVSAYVAVYVERGRIQVTMDDGYGTSWPTGEKQAESASTEMRGIAIDQMAPLNADGQFGTHGVNLNIRAVEDFTVFYVDSVTLTQSPLAVPYVPDMGPQALWRAAADYLLENAGTRSTFSGQALDVTFYDTGAYEEIVLGSWVRIRDHWNGSVFGLIQDARVTRLTEEQDPVNGAYTKTIEVAAVPDSAASRLSSRRTGATIPPAPPAIAPSANGSVGNQSYELGSFSTADVLATVECPLRGVSVRSRIDAAYIINAETIALDATNTITVKLISFLTGNVIAEVDNSSFALTRMGQMALTVNTALNEVEPGDTLYVEITGAGTGQATSEMVIVLESSFGGASVPPDLESFTQIWAALSDDYIGYFGRDEGNIGSWTWTDVWQLSDTSNILYMEYDEAEDLIFVIRQVTSSSNFVCEQYDNTGTLEATLYTFVNSPQGLAVDKVNQKVWVLDVDLSTVSRAKSFNYGSATLVDNYLLQADDANVNALTNFAYDGNGKLLFLHNPSSGNKNVKQCLTSDGTVSTLYTFGNSNNAVDNAVASAIRNRYFGYFDSVTDEIEYFTPNNWSAGETAIETGVGTDRGLAADWDAQQLYWAVSSNLKRKDFDGSNEVTCGTADTNILAIAIGY